MLGQEGLNLYIMGGSAETDKNTDCTELCLLKTVKCENIFLIKIYYIETIAQCQSLLKKADYDRPTYSGKYCN